jgi:hypothetical protein
MGIVYVKHTQFEGSGGKEGGDECMCSTSVICTCSASVIVGDIQAISRHVCGADVRLEVFAPLAKKYADQPLLYYGCRRLIKYAYKAVDSMCRDSVEF